MTAKTCDAETMTLERRKVTVFGDVAKGDLVKVRGEEGTFKFGFAQMRGDDIEWVLVWATGNYSGSRIFDPSRILQSGDLDAAEEARKEKVRQWGRDYRARKKTKEQEAAKATKLVNGANKKKRTK